MVENLRLREPWKTGRKFFRALSSYVRARCNPQATLPEDYSDISVSSPERSAHYHLEYTRYGL